MTVNDDIASVHPGLLFSQVRTDIVFRTPSVASTCVEVAMIGGVNGDVVEQVRIRDSKLSVSPEIVISHQTFELLEQSPGEGLFSADDTSIEIRFSAEGLAVMSQRRSGVELSFDADEWATFVKGCRTGFFHRSEYGISA